jgi:hypothetical protein
MRTQISAKNRSTFTAIILYFLISINFALNLSRDGKYYLDIQRYERGEFDLPYQYRILMAPVFSLTMRMTEHLNLSTIMNHIPSYLSSPEQICYLIVNSIAFFIAILEFSVISKIVFSDRLWRAAANFLFIVYTYILFVLNSNLCFILPYDLPALAFTQLCTILILREKWKTLCIVFAIATANRETTFIVDIFLFVRWAVGAGSRIELKVAAILAIEWVAIKALLFITIAGDHMTGSVALWRLHYNLLTMLKVWQWPSVFTLFVPTIVAVALLNNTKDPEQRAWAITYLIGFSLIFLVANITEHRAFGDLTGFATITAMFFLADHACRPKATSVEPGSRLR